MADVRESKARREMRDDFAKLQAAVRDFLRDPYDFPGCEAREDGKQCGAPATWVAVTSECCFCDEHLEYKDSVPLEDRDEHVPHERAETTRILAPFLPNGPQDLSPSDPFSLWLHPSWRKCTAGYLAECLRALVDAAPIVDSPRAGQRTSGGCKMPARVPSSERIKAGRLAVPAERWVGAEKGRRYLLLTEDVVRAMFSRVLSTKHGRRPTARRLLAVLREEAPRG